MTRRNMFYFFPVKGNAHQAILGFKLIRKIREDVLKLTILLNNNIKCSTSELDLHKMDLKVF